jgi:hypothetical protein
MRFFGRKRRSKLENDHEHADHLVIRRNPLWWRTRIDLAEVLTPRTWNASARSVLTRPRAIRRLWVS